MKQIRTILAALILLIGASLYISHSDTETAQAVAPANSATQTISVAGKGEMIIQPDIANIQVGVSTQGKTSEDAASQNAQVMAKIQESLRSQGIAKDDVKTIQFTNFPHYEWENNKNVLKGYQVDHILRVTTRDLDHLGKLVDAVTAAGANRIENIQFDTEKTSEYEGKVLEKAMNNALKKATVLANVAGKKIKGVITVTEMGTDNPPIRQPYQAMKAAESMNSTPISQGSMNIQANVTVVYEME